MTSHGYIRRGKKEIIDESNVVSSRTRYNGIKTFLTGSEISSEIINITAYV